MPEGIVVGIDASRNRSGGARSHIEGIIREGEPIDHGVRVVHLWSYRALLDTIPDKPWLVKHNPKELEQSLAKQVWWQATRLAVEAAAAGCDVLFATDASTLCRYSPQVVMSQDMLSYEPGVIRSFGLTRARLRLLAILLIQNRAMRNARGVVFLSRHAARVIQDVTGRLPRVTVIPHGVAPAFKGQARVQPWPKDNGRPVRCLYVSNTAMYKNQWVVVRAMAMLRDRGHSVQLILAGGGAGRARSLLDREIARSDPRRSFVQTPGHVPHDELPALLAGADLFIFASSCENLPITLLEAMAVGLPIVCSDRGPMPEMLQDGGVFCNPEDAESIASAVERVMIDVGLRTTIARRAKKLSEQYTWPLCAARTWEFLRSVAGEGTT
jgi:glycosyltransferase involved in cell wall biosynthesis